MKLQRRSKLERALLCISIKTGRTDLPQTSLTNVQLAKLADMSPSYLGKVERERANAVVRDLDAAVRDLVIQIAAE
jgi:hypothetical protein